MAKDKNTIARLKILDELLTVGTYDKEELLAACNERLDDDYQITARTLSNDLSVMQKEPFNVLFEEGKKDGKKKLWHIVSGHSLYTTKLSNEEKNLFREVLQTIGKFSGVPSFEWLGKLSDSLGVPKSNFKIINFSSSPVTSDLLGKLFHFIANKRVVELYYRTFRDPEEKHISFCPYQLKQYNNRWFVIGVAEKDNFMLNFSLNNVYKVEDAGKSYPSYPLTLEQSFDQIVGVTIPIGKKKENIVCWVDAKGFPYLITKPIHKSMKEITDSERIRTLRERFPRCQKGHFVEMNLIINTELKQILSSYIGEIVVLEPSSLRADMREIAYELFLRHEE